MVAVPEGNLFCLTVLCCCHLLCFLFCFEDPSRAPPVAAARRGLAPATGRECRAYCNNIYGLNFLVDSGLLRETYQLCLCYRVVLKGVSDVARDPVKFSWSVETRAVYKNVLDRHYCSAGVASLAEVSATAAPHVVSDAGVAAS